jgi:hypothetical protein
MPGEVKCMLCLHQRQACTIDPGYVGPKKRRRTETDASTRRMATRGKSSVFASFYDTNDFVSIGETQQSAGSGADIDAEGEADLAEYLPTISPTLLGLQKTRDRLDARLQSTAFELRLFLDDRKVTKALLDDVDVNIVKAEAEQEGESEVKEDELVEEMVDEEISRAK